MRRLLALADELRAPGVLPAPGGGAPTSPKVAPLPVRPCRVALSLMHRCVSEAEALAQAAAYRRARRAVAGGAA
jgi:hypothetical protein